MTEAEHALAEELLATLRAAHGPVLGGVDLMRALGYRNANAMRQARYRGQITLTLFTLPNRRGHYALTAEVAEWLAKARTNRAVPGAASDDTDESAPLVASPSLEAHEAQAVVPNPSLPS